MPTTIPYDPSLVLGSIVHAEILQHMLELSQAQAPIDAAQDTLNSLISVRRSLDMSVQEMMNLNIPVEEVLKEITVINKDIEDAGKDYAKAWVDNVARIKELKSKQLAVHVDYESPVNYGKSDLKSMPLAADSLKLEAQYFSFESNEQSSLSTISNIKGFISNSTSILGSDKSFQVSSAATTQVSSQLENHNISGTLVISATCTHKNAQLLAPFVIDVDKAIRVWNKLFPSDEDKIKTDSPASIAMIAAKAGTREEKSFNIISGATYGSCFIGMVHVLNKTSTRSSQAMVSLAESLQTQASVGKWWAHESGGFGISSSFSSDIKNMLSAQNITSHVSLVTMGFIPSIVSGQVKSAVKQFANFDGAQIMKNLSDLANNTSSEQDSVRSSAEKARVGGQMMSMQKSQISSVMLGVSTIDSAANKMLDINTMMTAFEDYAKSAATPPPNVPFGVPINYYLKPITQAQLAEMWVGKYYPQKFLAVSGDDVTGSPAPQPGGGNTAATTNTNNT
ncbi:hypothetical protein FAM09_13915 [Niastella caeni]|uniref:Uncharacterized protein n=1 Tax=Niastella caeni TaxID=2569763 RepID=A0A4S8HVD7_9BACT|nr:hypothetical protein [Niastella caeni]THU39593.1 hypothetical protein FAM09_13915 [Niastella caeni]